MRLTLYAIPSDEYLLTKSHLPIGVVIQPLAKLRYDEVRSNDCWVENFTVTRAE
jgi:hypothetical protein